MENKSLWFVKLVIALVFGMIVVGCRGDNDSTNVINDDTENGGIFTLLDIPLKYNDMVVSFEADNDEEGDGYIYLGGAQVDWDEKSHIIYTPITNGKVSIYMWIETATGKFVRYYGNDTMVEIDIGIYDPSDYNHPKVEIYFENITFSKGSATKSWNDAEEIDEF